MLACSAAAFGEPPAPAVCSRLADEGIVKSPSGAWPLKCTFHRLYTERPRILEPVFPSLAGTRWDLLIIGSAGRIEARDAIRCESIWPKPILCAREPRLLGYAADRLILATDQRIFAVSQQDGSISWSFGEEAQDRPLDDPEWSTSWKCLALTERQVFAASDHGDLLALDVVGGGVLWRKSTGLRIKFLIASGDDLVATVETPEQTRFLFYDSKSGREFSRLTRDEASSVEFIGGCKQYLIGLLSKSLVCVDTNRRELRGNASTSGRFVPSTLQLSGDRLIVSPDGRRLACYETGSLRRVWQSDSIWSRPEDAMWTANTGGLVLAEANDRLSGFCMSDGHLAWQTRIPRLSHVFAPRLNDKAIIVVAEGEEGEPRRYQIVAIAPESGRRLNGDLVTEPLNSLSEIHLRDRCIILSTDQQLIGYGPDH